jgi:hypothetical protein
MRAVHRGVAEPSAGAGAARCRDDLRVCVSSCIA